ncbi:Serine/threonine-protein kinase/endoribonuclease ire-1 [Orchesella cincta]|uniref:Serine/threonine-protein kinase/endoribonuclease ire-1 n=1 Tax=Orchesella cincta TaxID=48709 RepID=A0A1D2M548_ORCCI|nr:Serine/threonine-protein kinase/endoribonuclease ire-1 [Orchesella cincta]
MGLVTNRSNQVFQLYSILQQRVNAFDALLEGLQETNQTGALDILTFGMEQNCCSFTLTLSYDRNTVLGLGGYGTVVYKGKIGERDVAIKKVHLSMFGGDQALHEVTVLKDVDAHENVNKWVENNAQNIRLTETSELSCMEVLRQITTGLEWLHSEKIVHRDIKPENVLLLLQMKRAKLSDFGLSRRILDGSSFVVTSNVGGTHGLEGS